MSDATLKAMEDAILAHIKDGHSEPEYVDSLMLSEFVVFTACEYMDPEKSNVTSYGWGTTKGITSSHLHGLIQVGLRMVEDE